MLSPAHYPGSAASSPNHEGIRDRRHERRRYRAAAGARTQLCLGQRLRRAGERRRAREQLDQALKTFRRLGAQPWAAQADSELAAAGAIRTPAAQAHTDQPAHQLLTAQELQVAIAVGEGKTNKQAAAALFLDPAGLFRVMRRG